jgi:hypothetical protein
MRPSATTTARIGVVIHLGNLDVPDSDLRNDRTGRHNEVIRKGSLKLESKNERRDEASVRGTRGEGGKRRIVIGPWREGYQLGRGVQPYGICGLT